MNGDTHILGGALAGCIYAKAAMTGDFGLTIISQQIAIASIGFAMLGGIFPDIDVKGSKMSKKIFPASVIIRLFFGHRTFFHSPLLMIVIYILMRTVFPEYQGFTVAFLFGIASHLGLDMLNKKGIPLLYPMSLRFWIIGIKNDGFGEMIVRICLMGLVVMSIVETFY